MHKIPKLENAWMGGIYPTPLWQQTMNNSNNFSSTVERYKRMGFDMTEAAKAAVSINPGLQPPKSLIPSSTGTIVKPKQEFLKSDLGKSLIENSPQIGDAILKNVATEATEQSGWDTAFSKTSDIALNMAFKTGNPWLMAGAGVLKGVDWLNRYAGKTVKDSGTGKLDVKGYQTEMEKAGKFTLFGSGKAKKAANLNKEKQFANLQKFQASNLASQDLLAGQQAYQNTANKNYQQLMGFSKKGGTINPAILRTITFKVKKSEPIFIEELEIEKFENGGTLKNVIPDGALHARKHNLEGDIAEFITDKGIPVITIAEAGEEIINDDGKKILAEGGEITQHAEIERDEIIFSKPTTDQLEEYFKQYSESDSDEEKNRILLECGRFLASEILENTIDNTGIINETVVK